MMRIARTRLPALFLLFICALLWACGYRIHSPASSAAKRETLAIPALKNSTRVFQVEQRLTRALIEEFSRRSRYRVTSSEQGADAAIRGEILDVSAAPVIIGNESFGTTFLVTLSAQVQMVDLKTQQVLFRNDHYLFREEYVINSEVTQFFSEMNPALERIARDFAESVAATVLAGN